MRKASNTSRVVWAILVGGAFLSITLMQLTSAAAKPPDGKGGGGGKGKDNTPPAKVTDLAAVATTHRLITVQWKATGDDGNDGIATRYDLRYSFEPITDLNWDLETTISAFREPTPGPSGTIEISEIRPLFPETDLFIAIRVIDDNDNVSPLSNVIFESTDPAPATPWVVAPVWVEGASGGDANIAIDPDTEFPSIAFMHWSPNEEFSDLHFARWNGDSWDFEIVPVEAFTIFDHQYDPISGMPVIMYYGQTKFGYQSVNLAWHDGVQWQTEFVDQTGINAWPSLAFAPDGTPTIAYWKNIPKKGKNVTNDVVLARRNVVLASLIEGSWQVEVVVPDTIARETSLLFHPDTGFPMLAYGQSDIHLASFNGTQWLIEPVPINSEVNNVQLAIEPLSGEPAITAQGADSGAELCTRSSPGDWICEVYHHDSRAGRRPNLLFSDDGTPIIVHNVGAGSAGAVVFFSFRDQTGVWIHEEIDVNGWAGFSHSITPTPWGTFFVAFTRRIFNALPKENQHLFFAERVGN